MAGLEGEQERVESRKILNPTWEAVAGHNERLFQLAVQFRRQLRVHELRKRLHIESQVFLVLGQDVIDIGVHSVQELEELQDRSRRGMLSQRRRDLASLRIALRVACGRERQRLHWGGSRDASELDGVDSGPHATAQVFVN